MTTGSGFLSSPTVSPEARKWFDENVAEFGYVMNVSRLWAYRPAAHDALFELLGDLAEGWSLRKRGVLVVACASALGDAMCALAWGSRLAGLTDPSTVAGVLRGDDRGLTPDEQAMAGWARKVARDPNGTCEADVERLRQAGFGDTEIFAMTMFIALRIAFSTVNDGLGVHPDAGFRSLLPPTVLEAITFGRPIEP
jgi:alkylhydroperoxidase family enzyme